MNWIDSILRRTRVRPIGKSSLTPNPVRRTSRLRLEELELREVPAVITEFGVPTPVARLTALTTGPDGNLWFAEQNANQIGRITTSGIITEFALPANSNPNYITTGPDGALWFTNPGNNTIGRITTSGTITEFTIPTAGSGPAGIVTGPDGALWFAEQDGGKIGRVTTSGSFTEYGAGFLNSPYGITVGPDGALWFTQINADEIGKIVPSGVNAGSITLYDLAPGSSPRGITSGSDGNLWFTESGSNQIGRITTGGVITEFAVTTLNSYPAEITSGPGGALFFSEGAANKIGRITTGGAITEYDVPTANSAPNGITFGPDNNIWFVGYIGNQVASLSLGPVATDDSYTAVQNTPLTKNAVAGVLANDTGTGTLTPTVVANPSHGTLTLNPDGSFTYTPDTGYRGPDSFTYKATDGTTDSNTATVSITVDAPPVAVTDSYKVTANMAFVRNAAQGVLANDTDADGDPLTAAVVANPSHGTLTLNPDGSFTYTPDTGYFGPDSFTYKATDGTTGSNTATVSITVNTPPSGVTDSYSTAPNMPLVRNAAQGVLANDTDADADALSVLFAWTGNRGTNHGTLTLNADGSFTYTPDAGYSGLDSFVYQATDGTGDSTTVTVSITVNTPPVAVTDSYTAVQDTPLTKAAAAGLLANDTDADGNPLAAVLVANPSHGTLTLNADGSFTYTPDTGYAGADSFTYKANDGIADSTTVTVNITVDVPPVAVNDSYATGNAPLTKSAAQGVLVNDTDADGNPLAASLVTGPAHGTVTLNADGSFTYTPDVGYSGSDSFTYEATDGTANSNVATVSLVVNTPPVAVADGYTVVEGATVTKNAAAGVLSNDTDADGNPLAAILVAGPAHGTLVLNSDGSFAYTPNRGYSGGDSFTYKANDGTAGGNTVTVTVTVTALPVPVKDVNGDGRADIIVGTASANSHIKVFSGTDGSLVSSFYAFDGYQGGVASTGGDTNDDGRTDVIAGSATTGSHVKVFDGATGALVRSFQAFQGFDGGVVLASGDVNGDGFADIIVGTRTGSSHIKVYSGADGSELSSFLAFANYVGGVSLASGDVDGDGFDDLIVGATSGGPAVKVFSGRTGAVLQSYMAFAGYLGGVSVAVGDLNGDGLADVVAGAATGSAHVKAFSGADGSELRSFLALPNFVGDLSIAVADANGDGVPDIIAGSKTGAARITSVNGMSLSPDDSFLAFDDFLGGVAVS